ncbi:LacI family DNA-binding transcriptional regulator [Psychromicrobium xiongbiense]|uniref:LacI family DNA-binding transcriptional regulator n=1 Tax=Psychromicrobium xiongbiense TaxID=3051184 RepID=UPI002553252D|nr:LacI family DNA-binding transcriptional regulator [Psychromicrobium sp. YIM S02556]
MARRATIRELAATLGVSPSTVSRAFTRPQLLTPAMVTRIKEAAKAANYVPNNNARALSTGLTGAIGLVVPDISNPFFPPLIRAAQAHAALSQRALFLADSNDLAEEEEKLISSLASRVEGLILASSRLKNSRLRELAGSQRLVLINRDVPETSRVLIDTASAMRQAMDSLLTLGHRRFAYVGGSRLSWSEKRRRATALAFGEEHGVSVQVVDAHPGDYETARTMVPTLLEAQVTAVMAFDDVVAHGVMGGLAERGHRVPADLSVVGCDDILTVQSVPALSTLSMPVELAARSAVTALLMDSESSTVEPARFLVEGRYITRGTTGPVSTTPTPPSPHDLWDSRRSDSR